MKQLADGYATSVRICSISLQRRANNFSLQEGWPEAVKTATPTDSATSPAVPTDSALSVLETHPEEIDALLKEQAICVKMFMWHYSK